MITKIERLVKERGMGWREANAATCIVEVAILPNAQRRRGRDVDFRRASE
jgi:hypothetical protein